MKQIILLVFVFLLSACTRNLPPTASTTSPTEPVAAPATQSQPAPSESSAASQAEAANADERAFEKGVPLAARVNNQPIFLETYQNQVNQFERALINQGIDPASENGQIALVQVQRQVLDALVDQAILEQEANKLDISISEEELEAKVQESIDQGQEQFETWLETNNLTLVEFKKTLRFQLIANQMFEQITADVSTTAEQIQLRQILVADEATARQIIEQLKAGVDFATLAEEYSLDETNRENGGSLGWFPRQAGLVPPEVEEIAFTLQVNEVSGPIKTPLGFHIIQLEERDAERPMNPEIVPVLKEHMFTNWLTEQRSTSMIEKFVGL